MTYQYKVKNLQEAEAIFLFLNSKGYTHDNVGGNLLEQANYYFRYHPYFQINVNKKHLSGNTYELNQPKNISFEEIFALPVDKSVEIVLNSEHTAVVSKKGITVGCQTFPLDIVEKLVEAKKTVLN